MASRRVMRHFNESFVRIGIDVGGTHTDAVLLENDKTIATIKVQTTSSITECIITAFKKLIQESQYKADKIAAIIIGTTHFINSVLQAQNMNSVILLRFGKPATTAAEPLFDWPNTLKNKVINAKEILFGGHEYNGIEISPLDVKRLMEIAQYTKDHNIGTVAITSVFANVNSAHEKEAYQILKKINPKLNITLSHEIGGMNLLLRENAAVLNAILTDHFNQFHEAIKLAISNLHLNHAALFFSLNNGTIENPQSIFPITTYCSGQSNSMRGAALLSEVSDAIVIDIGGTSADVGIIKKGFPLEAGHEIKIGNEVEGIRCSFPAPLTRSYGLGGGSVITINGKVDIQIGPNSIGFELQSKAIIFGGNVLTLTDIAVAKGRLQLGNNSLLKNIPQSNIDKIDEIMHQKLAAIVKGMLPYIESNGQIPLVLVGGGAFLFDKEKLFNLLKTHINQIIIPSHANYANAIGAAFGKVSGCYHGIYQYASSTDPAAISRKKALEIAEQNARKIAIEKGAEPSSLIIQEVVEAPINYLPGNSTNLTIKVIGDIQRKNVVNLNNNKVQDKAQSVPSSLNLSTNYTNNINSQPKSFSQHQVNTDLLLTTDAQPPASKELTEMDIIDMALGCGFLGSGGGGDTKMCELLNRDMIKKKHKIKLLQPNELSDESLIVAIGVMGAPTILTEKIPSNEESINAIKTMEKELGQQIDYLIPFEIGGMNGLYPLYISALINKAIVDGDYMGRAFPELQMITPHIYGKIQNCIAVLSNGKECHVIRANNLSQLEKEARQKTIEMGGIVTLAYLPLSGREVKQYCVPMSFTVAKMIGKELKSINKNTLSNINNYKLKQTGYGPVELILSGRIIDIKRDITHGFNKGHVLIKDHETNRLIRVDFQNENLRIIDETSKLELATVPTIITLIDNEQKPLSCECLRVGLEITLLTLQVPSILSAQAALKVVGPQAFNLERDDCQKKLTNFQRDYILEETVLLMSCVAHGLGVSPLPATYKNSQQKPPVFIVYPGGEEKAFIEGRTVLNYFDENTEINQKYNVNKKLDAIYEVKWLGVNIHEQEQGNDQNANNEDKNQQARIINQILLKELLQAKVKNLIFLISIGRPYHEGNKFKATIALFKNIILSCRALIMQEKHSTIISMAEEKRKGYLDSLKGEWSINILVADTLQAYNSAENEEQRSGSKLKFKKMGEDWVKKAVRVIISELLSITSSEIRINIRITFWDGFLDTGKAAYYFEEKFAYLKDVYENPLNDEIAVGKDKNKSGKDFHDAVLKKGIDYKKRQNESKCKKDINIQAHKNCTILREKDREIYILGSSALISSYQSVIKDNMWITKALIFNLQSVFQHHLYQLSKGYFNVPALPKNSIKRRTLLNQLENCITDTDTNTKSNIVVCRGMGGIGKSHLALTYLYEESQKYIFKIWINASTEKSLTQDLVKLGKLLNMNDDVRLIERVIQFLKENPNWLIVLEDLQDEDLIEKYLPQQNGKIVGGHIIITTRKNTWQREDIKLIDVKQLNEQEAIDLLISKSGRKEDKHKNLAKIADKLNYFPLALEMIGGYLRNNNEISLERFLELYPQLFNDVMGTNNQYSLELARKVVSACFEASIKRIQQDNKETKRFSLAEIILHFSCFTGSQYVNQEYLKLWLQKHFKQQIEQDNELVNRSLQQLADYNLINYEGNEAYSFRVHLILKEVMRNQLMQKEKPVNALQSANLPANYANFLLTMLISITEYMSCIEQTTEVVIFEMEILLKYFDEFLLIENQQESQFNKELETIIFYLAKLYKYHFELLSAKSILKRLLHLQGEDSDPLIKAKILLKLGRIYQNIAAIESIGYTRKNLRHGVADKIEMIRLKIALKKMKIIRNRYEQLRDDAERFSIECKKKMNPESKATHPANSEHHENTYRSKRINIDDQNLFKAINLYREVVTILNKQRVNEIVIKSKLKVSLLMGNIHLILNNSEAAIKLLHVGLSAIDNIILLDNWRLVAQGFIDIGKAYADLGYLQAAQDSFESAFKLFKQYSDEINEEIGETLLNLAKIHDVNRNYNKKMIVLEKALDYYDAIITYDKQQLFAELYNIGILGNLCEIQGIGDELIQKIRNNLSSPSYTQEPDIFDHTHNYIISLLEDYRLKFNHIKKSIIRILYELITVYAKIGEIDKGRACIERVLNLYQNKGLDTNQYEQFINQKLKLISTNINISDQERKDIIDLEPFIEIIYGKGSIELIRVFYQLAIIYNSIQCYDKHACLLEKIRLYAINHFDSEQMGALMYELGSAYYSLGRYESAYDYIKAAKQLLDVLPNKSSLLLARIDWLMYKVAKRLKYSRPTQFGVLQALLFKELSLAKDFSILTAVSLYTLGKIINHSDESDFKKYQKIIIPINESDRKHWPTSNQNFAIYYLNKALHFCETLQDKGYPLKIRILYELCRAYAIQGNFHEQIKVQESIVHLTRGKYRGIEDIDGKESLIKAKTKCDLALLLMPLITETAQCNSQRIDPWNPVDPEKIIKNLNRSKELAWDVISLVQQRFRSESRNPQVIASKLEKLTQCMQNYKQREARYIPYSILSLTRKHFNEWKMLFFNALSIINMPDIKVPIQKINPLQKHIAAECLTMPQIKRSNETIYINNVDYLDVKLESNTSLFFQDLGDKHITKSQWKKFPVDRLVGKYVGHKLRFFTMAVADADQARAFAKYLQERGFDTGLKKAKDKPSVVVDFDDSNFLKIASSYP